MNWIFGLLMIISMSLGMLGLGIFALFSCIVYNVMRGLYRYIRYGEV